jgi:tryptophan synthase alpha chain
MSATTSSEVPLAAAFAAAAGEGRAALIPYVTAGHPVEVDPADVLDMLASEGADLVEVGVPFSDPLADGPVIQRSSFEALRSGMDARRVLETVSRFRSRHAVPVVLFTYLNPVLRFGLDAFLGEAHAAGASGILITDLPAGADPELEARLAASPLDPIRLVAPTTPPERLLRIVAGARGFLYYVARTGVTGVSEGLRSDLAERVLALRAASPLPVAVGFGISTAEQARRVAGFADGVVVGSALVRTLGEGGLSAGALLLRDLRSAMEREAER